MARWVEVGERVLMWRQPVLDVNAVLVVGGEGALVVDTLSTPDQAAELAAAVREVTPLGWRIVNTHHHFDHCYGNQTLAGARDTEIWAQEACVARFARWQADGDGRARVAEVAAEYAATMPGFAAAIGSVTLRGPNRSVARSADLDLGDRVVGLRHLGRGHTDNDLVIVVPDAGVVLAGDLVEDGAPPSFEDSFPLDWPATVAALLALEPSVVVPGHGGAMSPAAVRAQWEELGALARACRAGWATGSPSRTVAAGAPFGSAVAVERAYAALDGR